jgi:hypothetical protein
MTELIERLEALGGIAQGDWLDVVARAERHRSRQLRRRVLIATGHWDVVSLTATDEEVPLPQGESTLGYVIGDRLQLPGRPPAKLAAPLLPAYAYPPSQLVVPSPDRRKVVYQMLEGSLRSRNGRPQPQTPVLRIFDSDTARDAIVARGAHSPAWRADGVLAYTSVPAAHRRGGRSAIVGHIVAKRSLQEPAVRWSTFASTWSNLVWAGEHLVARAQVLEPFKGARYQVHAFSGPGRSRRLPLSGVIAVSPDGRFVFGHTDPYGGQGSNFAMRLVEVETGRIADTITQSSGPGAWWGDTIIMTSGFALAPLPPGPGGVRILPGPSHVKVVVLHYADGKLTLERELRFSREVIEATGLRATEFYFGFAPPAFVDKAARQFTAELVIHNTLSNRQDETRLVYLTCDRIELRCRRGRSLDPRSNNWSSLVSNPSRPLPD